jgi:hypothetical protein
MKDDLEEIEVDKLHKMEEEEKEQVDFFRKTQMEYLKK